MVGAEYDLHVLAFLDYAVPLLVMYDVMLWTCMYPVLTLYHANCVPNIVNGRYGVVHALRWTLLNRPRADILLGGVMGA